MNKNEAGYFSPGDELEALNQFDRDLETEKRKIPEQPKAPEQNTSEKRLAEIEKYIKLMISDQDGTALQMNGYENK